MSLILSLEQGPRPQAVRQMRLDDGTLVIGRGADADWRIDDPDMFVSRAHCTISGGAAGFTVTDTSSGGLYVDDARAPLGPGNSAPLRDGTRLRLGDYLLRAEITATQAYASRAQPLAQPAPASRAQFDHDDFFATPPHAEPAPVRPAGLPPEFEKPVAGRYFAPEPAAPERRAPPVFDDPFTLDPAPTPRATDPAPSVGFDWNAPAADVARPAPEPVVQPRAQEMPSASPDLRDAFLRGLGIDPAEFPTRDALAQMEDFGRDYRLMLEGLMHLLRKRAQEKNNARVARTVVGASEVNPLKFMPTVEDALATLIAERSPGFLGSEAAITGAVRDLAQHHVDAWRGVQSALAAMINRFDPAALEEELKAHSALTTLLAGGRRAKLWELYEERYREIAKSAETRFLGEVGADFRDAYENNKGD